MAQRPHLHPALLRRLLARVVLACAWLLAGPAHVLALPADPTPTTLADDPTAVAMPGEVTKVTGQGGRLDGAVGQSGALDAEKRCLARPLRAIEWQGCDGARCEDPDERARMESLMDLTPGTPLRAGGVQRAVRRLLQLGFFQRVTVECDPDLTGQAQVRINVVGNQFVRRVDFVGNAQVFEDELRAKLLIRPGDILNPGTLEARTALNLQATAITGLYQRYGFDQAKAELKTVPFDGGRSNELLLLVTIDEGAKQRVTSTRLRLESLPAPSEAEERAGLVCPKVSERVLRDVSDLQNIEVFTRRAANKARANIRTYLRRLGFANPQVAIPEPRDNTIDVTVRPGRCNLLRVFMREEASATRSASFRLVTPDDDAQVYESLPFAESGIFEFDEADRGRLAVGSVLENRGYLFADVRLDYRPVPPGLDSQVETAISYYVTTGFVSQIRGIQFPGRGTLDLDQMKAAISTKAYDLLNAGGYLQVDQLQSDLDALRQSYVAAGYFHFRYPMTLPADITATQDHLRSVDAGSDGSVIEYRFRDKGFRIRRPMDEDFIYVEIPVEPGQRTHLGTLQVDGHVALSRADVRENLGLRPGEVLSYDILAQALGQLERRYRNTGFFRAHVDARCTAHGPDRPEVPCTFDAMQAETVDVHVHVTEGERVEIGEIFVRGNFETATDVILRDLPAPGQPFSADLLFDSQRRLRNLGLFAQVGFDYIGEDESPPRQRLAVVVEVAENSFRWMEYAVGVQTINQSRTGERSVPTLLDSVGQATAAGDRATGAYNQNMTLHLPNLLLTGEAAWVNRNFLHSGKQVRVPLKVGLSRAPACDQGGVTCADQTWLDTIRLISLTPTYTDSRLLGSDVTLNLTAPYFVHDYASGVVDVDRAGALVQMARRFGKLVTALAFDAGVIRTRLLNTPTPANGFDLKPQFQLSPSVTWDRTDSPINPTRGVFLSGTVQYINAEKLVTASPDKSKVGTYEHGNYLKYEATAKGFIPIGQAMVIALLVHGGGSQRLGEDAQDLPDWARFQLGGVQGLRGYTDLGVREYLRDGSTKSIGSGGTAVSSDDAAAIATKVGGNVVINGSVEARFPILRDAGIWGAGFWDWGGLADGFDELYPSSIRHGVGAGLRWLLSGQIPVRIDYGIAIGKRIRDIAGGVKTPDDFGALSLSVMYSF